MWTRDKKVTVLPITILPSSDCLYSASDSILSPYSVRFIELVYAYDLGAVERAFNLLWYNWNGVTTRRWILTIIIFSRFDTIPEHNRRTNRHATTALSALWVEKRNKTLLFMIFVYFEGILVASSTHVRWSPKSWQTTTMTQLTTASPCLYR